MDAQTFRELQEGLLYCFGPVLFWWFVITAAAGIISAIGVVILRIVSRMTR